jgi:hypothetical protein
MTTASPGVKLYIATEDSPHTRPRPEEVMTKRVRVQLIGIKNVHTGDDPGGNLEVYGDLFARRVFVNEIGEFQALDTQQMFHRASADALDISEGAIFTLGETRELGIEPGEFLWLGGHLAEQDDTSANDNLGFIDKKIPHDAIQSGPQFVVYRESEQEVEARFTTTVL